MRALVALLVLTASAAAQPDWTPRGGWDTAFERDARAIEDAHVERVRQMKRSFEATKQNMDDDFHRTARWMIGGFIGFVLLAGIASGIAAHRRNRNERSAEWMTPIAYAPIATAPSATVDVTVLRIAVDGRASKFVQAELEAIVNAHDTTTEHGRAKRLREVSIVLRRVRDSWVYAGADNEPMRPRAEALTVFTRHVDDARTRLRQQPTSIAPPAGRATTIILVSVIVAARGELISVTDLATGEDLRRALESAAHRAPEDLLAVEVVWDPSEPERTLSSVDLEASYRTSELHRLQGAVVGKAFCTYCAGPFPAELVSCPHCGAPARGRGRTG